MASFPSTPAESFLAATVVFEDPSLEGSPLVQVKRSYRPLMDVNQNEWTSCFFERIGNGQGALKLGKPYKVFIRLLMPAAMEEHYGKSVRQLFPRGRKLHMVSLPRKVLATGTVDAIVSELPPLAPGG